MQTKKNRFAELFSQYLSPALVEQLAEDPDKLVLGGETKKMTFFVMLEDLQLFPNPSNQTLKV